MVFHIKIALITSILFQRVKVYRLNDDGKWDDQGTGHVTVDYLERSEEVGLLVVDEADNETLLLHRISSDDIYRKQEDTIISWRDPEYSTELALSFQETTGCGHIWEQICNVQRNMQLNNLNSDRYHSINSELRELPPVEISTLPLILKVQSNFLLFLSYVLNVYFTAYQLVLFIYSCYCFCCYYYSLHQIDLLHCFNWNALE
nr:serine/threonine-protein phosphatase 4 regulatory subunit 3-like isoform X4 [Ipomoea batatas]